MHHPHHPTRRHEQSPAVLADFIAMYAPHKIHLENLERFSDEERAHIEKALLFALAHHDQQRRVQGEPYITHPVAVAQLLIDRFGADADTVIVGLLHDTVEDTLATLELVEQEFGSAIRFLVDAVTDVGKGDGRPFIEDKTERAAASHEKIEEYARTDKRVYLVKIADRWHNLTHCHALRPKNQVRHARETLEFHVPIARELGLVVIADELEELARAVEERARRLGA